MSRTSRDTFNNWKWNQLSITFLVKKGAKMYTKITIEALLAVVHRAILSMRKHTL